MSYDFITAPAESGHRMSPDTSDWRESLSEREQNLAVLMGKRMNDTVYTKKALFKMGDKYELYDNVLNIGATITAGIVLGGSALDWLPVSVIIILSGIAAVFSFTSTYADFDRRAVHAERAAESYNTMRKRYVAYYHLVLKDEETPFDKKQERLQRLLDRHEELNNNTLSTDDDVFENITTEEVFSDLETTPDELNRLLNDGLVDGELKQEEEDEG